MRQDIQELKHFVLQLAGGRDVSGFNSGLGVNPSSTSTEYVEAAKLLSPESPDMMEPVRIRIKPLLKMTLKKQIQK